MAGGRARGRDRLAGRAGGCSGGLGPVSCLVAVRCGGRRRQGPGHPGRAGRRRPAAGRAVQAETLRKALAAVATALP